VNLTTNVFVVTSGEALYLTPNPVCHPDVHSDKFTFILTKNLTLIFLYVHLLSITELVLSLTQENAIELRCMSCGLLATTKGGSALPNASYCQGQL
jgi:hypothetical protein